MRSMRRWTRPRACLARVGQTRGDRGDVPGWVLITIMTAGLVIGIWAIAGPQLEGVFTAAVDRVFGEL